MARIQGLPGAPESHPGSEEEHRAIIARRASGCLARNNSEQMETPFGLASYATADLPSAADYEGFIVYDATTNTVLWSDGAVWATI